MHIHACKCAFVCARRARQVVCERERERGEKRDRARGCNREREDQKEEQQSESKSVTGEWSSDLVALPDAYVLIRDTRGLVLRS